jgi:hypothetical protein
LWFMASDMEDFSKYIFVFDFEDLAALTFGKVASHKSEISNKIFPWDQESPILNNL